MNDVPTCDIVAPMRTTSPHLRSALATVAVLALLMSLPSCLLFREPNLLEGLWQGLGDAVYGIQVWENGELAYDSSWEGVAELIVDVTSSTGGHVQGQLFWRDSIDGGLYSDPSPALPFSGTLTEGRSLTLTTDETLDIPVATHFEATFRFELVQGKLVGDGDYSEDGTSGATRVVLEIRFENLALSKL
jgi:hypothetical protein